jgi:endo-1,4-beta-xylanase
MSLVNLKNGINSTLIVGISLLIISCKPATQVSKDGNDTIPALYKSFENDFYIGTAFSSSHFSDSAYMATVVKHFNSVTAENAMKWEKIHPQPGIYHFTTSDSFIDFAEKNNIYIVGHVLVWHSQTPDWVFEDAKGKPVSRDTLLSRMHDHIKTVIGRYKGRVNCWDVVNEAIGDDNNMRKSKWYNIIGEDYVEKAFEYAREADSSAMLIYNDFSLPSAPRRNAVVKLIKKLQAKGIKVDGIGEQGHYHMDYPFLYELDSSIAAFAALGVKVMITELDINMLPFPMKDFGADVAKKLDMEGQLNPYVNGLPDSMQVALANRYADFFRIFLKYKENINRVTFWGINDGQSWLNYWPIFGRTNYPLLFDRQYQPKPAFWKLVELAKENK